MRRPDFRGDGPRLLFEELERRLLLSADLAPGLLEPPAWADPDAAPAERDWLEADAGEAAAVASRREVVFLDAGIDAHEALLGELEAAGGRWLEVVVLDSGRDGIEQIGEALARHRDLSGVHVLSHGSSDGLRLGSTWLGADTLASHATRIAGWGDALAPGADLLLYGCNLAGSGAGSALVASLAELTGADVAASRDASGSASLGGDWELEHRTGAIETSTPAVAGPAWTGLLAVENALWVSSAGDVSGSGAPGLDAWGDAAAVQIGPADLSLGAGTTGGTFAATGFDLDAFSSGPGPGVNAIHVVTRDLTLADDGAGGGFELYAGDLILSTGANQNTTLTSSNSISVKSRDVFVFRPDAPGDYSSGTFHLLLDSPLPRDVTGFTLVEQDTVLGDVTLAAGDLLLSTRGANSGNQILHLRPEAMDASGLQGSIELLLDGDDAGLGGFAAQIDGLELLETDTVIGGVTLPGGTLLLSFDGDASVGSNGLGVGAHDIVRLEVTKTSLGSGAGNGEALALPFFHGGDVNLDTGAEAIDGLSVVPVQVQQGPRLTLPGAPLDYQENDPATPIDASAGALGGDFDGGALVVEFLANGTASDRLGIQGGGALSVTGNEISYDAGAGAVVIGSFSGGGDGATPLVVSFGPGASPEAVEAVARSVTYQNASEDPSEAARVLRFTLSDADGASDAATATVLVRAVNDAPGVSVPGGQVVDAGGALVFSAAGGNAPSLGDADALDLEVTLATANGTLTLADVSGLTFSQGSGTGDTAMTFRGSIAAVNAALDGLRFDPAAGFDGDTSLSIAVSDLGQTGSGGVQGASAVVPIHVLPAPEPPPPPEPPPSPEPDEGGEGETPDPEAGDGDAGESAPPAPELELATPPTTTDLPHAAAPGPDSASSETDAPRPTSEAPRVDEPDRPEADAGSAASTGEPEDEDASEAPSRERPRFSVGLTSPVAAEALDELRSDLSEEAARAELQPTLAWTAVRGVAVAFSTSVLGAFLRAGSLLAMTLSSLPIWLRFDPLAILALSDTERRRREQELREAEEREDEAERRVGRLLDESEVVRD
jgi:hypothetical protein